MKRKPKRTRPQKPQALRLPSKADGVFRYHNGREEVYVDAFEILLAMESSKDLQATALRVDEATEAGQAPNLRDLMALVDLVSPHFGFTPYKEENGVRVSGMTKPECLAVFGKFIAWMADIKKKTARLADLASVYGAGVADLDDETRLGLWLHLNRQMARSSLPTVMAMQTALSGPSQEWLEAFVSREQAEAIASRAELMKQHYEVHNGRHNGL